MGEMNSKYKIHDKNLYSDYLRKFKISPPTIPQSSTSP